MEKADKVTKDERANSNRSDARWGTLVMKQGFVIVPTTLFVAQRRLEISVNEFNVLLQIVSFWWDESKLPFPSKQTLADRMNVSVKTVQRALASLEARKLLKRIERINPKHGRQANAYDLSGLVAKLSVIAGEQSRLKMKGRRVGRPR